MRPYFWRPADERSAPAGKTRAFTLVELLVVMGVIVAIIAISGPALSSLKNSGDVSKTVYDLAGILEQSRAYAMANNTYVYVGFGEADANSSSSGQQTFTGSTAIGRVSVAVVAMKDGSRGYDPNASSISGSWSQSYSQGSNLLIVGKVQTFTSIHLVDLGQRPSTGPMSRPPYSDQAAIDTKYNLGDPACASVTPIYYPPGTDSGSATYAFTKVIQFDPQGAARIQRDDNADFIPKVIEIGLQPTHGDTAPTLTAPVTSGNVAAIQIDGMIGSTRIYRP